ncbi:hypothetical protein [Phenylobacterium sp.]|uniref:hypothetical protein n=1 Tax=Phenylobacterium sp. TaxID=1871053 RepID=UPI0035B459A7
MSGKSSSQGGFFQRSAEQIAAAKAKLEEQTRLAWERGEDLADAAAKGLRTYAEAQTSAAQLQAAQQARALRAAGDAVVQAVRPKAKDVGLRGPQPAEPPRPAVAAPQGRYLADLTHPEANPFMTTYARDEHGNIDRSRSYIDPYPASGLGQQPMSTDELKGKIVDLLAGKPVDPGPHVTFVNDEPANPSPNQPLTTPTARMVAGGIVDSGVDLVNVNSTTGGKHDPKSRHYTDQAVDMNRINSARVTPQSDDAAHLQAVMARQSNIRDNFGPRSQTKVLSSGAPPVQWPSVRGGHQAHVHVSGQR